LAAAALSLPLSSVDAQSSDVALLAQALSPQETEAGEPKICRDDDGKVQRSVDLLLLLDNSTSLNLAKSPTDKDRLRFSAIRQMLDAVGSAVSGAESSLEVRFGVITFSADATELISLAENRLVTRDSATQLAQEIENRLPNETQSNGTNYVNALERAFGVFGASSSTDRCRVLVWLTDGEFSHGRSDAKTNEELATLYDRTCNVETGFAARARNARTRIWPYVVLLSPPTLSAIDGRKANIIRQSHDLMRRFTGAPLEVEGEQTLAACPGGAQTDRIGSIYSADQARNLGPVFEELGTVIAGGELIDACPIESKGSSSEQPKYQSIELPAPRFLSWISMVSLGRTQLPTVTQIAVISSENREESLLSHFEYRRVSESLLYLDAIQQSRLGSGWKLKVVGTNLEGYCLRGKIIESVKLKVTRLGATTPELAWGDGADNLTEADLEDVQFSLDGEVIERSKLASVSESDASRLSARLDVDPTGKLVPGGLEIDIVGFTALPSFDPQTCQLLRVPRPGVSGRGNTPSPREFASTTCRVDLRKVGSEVRIDVSNAAATLQSIVGCESTSLTPVVGGVERSTISGDSVFEVGVILRFDSNSLKCATRLLSSDNATLADAEIPIKLTFKAPSSVGSARTTTKQISVVVDIDVTPPPPWWLVWVITVGSVLLAILLSFGLLWLMNFLLIRLPKPTKFLVARLPFTISSRDPLKPEYQFGDMKVGDLVLSSDNFEGVRGDQSRWAAANGFVLQRKLSNPFLRPLHEPRAHFVGPSAQDSVVAYGPLFSEFGLKLPFQRALVLVLNRPESPSSPLKGYIFAILPNDPRDGGMEAAKKLFDSGQILPLVRALLRSDLLTRHAKSAEVTKPPVAPKGPLAPPVGVTKKPDTSRRRF